MSFASVDWAAVERDLDARGAALIRSALSPVECQALVDAA
jgi:hypothetical protein